MVNNNFQLIGTVIENFDKKVSGEYVFYEARLEVEGRANSGSVREFIIKVSSTNKNIRTDVDYLGKVVVVNGYIDSYKFEDGGIATKLCATDLYVASTETSEYPIHRDDDLPF